MYTLCYNLQKSTVKLTKFVEKTVCMPITFLAQSSLKDAISSLTDFSLRRFLRCSFQVDIQTVFSAKWECFLQVIAQRAKMRRFLRCSLQVGLEKPILYTSGRNCAHDLSKIKSELESRGCKNILKSRFCTSLKDTLLPGQPDEETAKWMWMANISSHISGISRIFRKFAEPRRRTHDN